MNRILLLALSLLAASFILLTPAHDSREEASGQRTRSLVLIQQ